MSELRMKYLDFNDIAINSLNDQFIDSYPIVYILNNTEEKPSAYIGQTVQVKNRMKNHLKNKDRAKLEKMILIGHKKFNQSATYDIETNLINYFIADNQYKLQNKSQINQQGTHNYYEKDYYHSQMFEEIWSELQINNLVKESLESLRNKDIFKLSPYKELSASQLELKQKIIEFCLEHIKNDEKAVFLINGEAGTGKSVVLSSTFNTIQDLSHEEYSDLYNTNNYLLVNHEEMLKTYKSISESLPSLKKKNFNKPTPFLNQLKKEKSTADITFIDEAHLLLTREDAYNNFKAQNQLEEIIKQSKVTVIVYDQKQFLKVKSHWNEDLIKKITGKVKVESFELTDQFRMQAEDDVIDWIDSFVSKKLKPLPRASNNFDFKVFESAAEMQKLIEEKNNDFKLSRIVSTFDYEHKKNGDDYYVEEPGFKSIWNRTDYKNTWAEEPETIKEVGSIYTIQGFDLNYVGVILGPSVCYDEATKSIYIDIKKYKDIEAFRGESGTGEKDLNKVKEQIVLNSINVLMKRGVKGLYIYASNKELRQALLKGGY